MEIISGAVASALRQTTKNRFQGSITVSSYIRKNKIKNLIFICCGMNLLHTDEGYAIFIYRNYISLDYWEDIKHKLLCLVMNHEKISKYQ